MVACFVSIHLFVFFFVTLFRLIIMIIINASILTFNILTFFCILLFLLVFVTSLCLGFLNFEIDTVTVVNTHETVCRKDRVDKHPNFRWRQLVEAFIKRES